MFSYNLCFFLRKITISRPLFHDNALHMNQNLMNHSEFGCIGFIVLDNLGLDTNIVFLTQSVQKSCAFMRKYVKKGGHFGFFAE